MKNITQKLFFTFAFTLAPALFAAPVTPPVGLYQFTQNIELVTAKKYERVNTLTQAGKDRVTELKLSGWTCLQQAGTLVQCSVFSKNESLPAVVAQQIQNKYQNMRLDFSSTFLLDLFNDAEVVQEYEVRQNVDVSGKIVDSYILQVIRDGLTKIQIPLATEKLFLYVVGEKTLGIQDSMTVTQKNTSVLYVVQITLKKD